MPVVSNTLPILNLAIVNQLILLRQQFSEILIPNDELINKAGFRIAPELLAQVLTY
jgi:predicted nucleic acid-binding protein